MMNKLVWGGLSAGLLLGAATPTLYSIDQTIESNNFKISEQTALPQTVANVNGVDIPFSLYWKRLLNRSGNEILLSVVDEQLISQAAQEKIVEFETEEPVKGGKRKKKVKTEAALSKIFEPKVGERYNQIKKEFPDEKQFLGQLQNSGLTEDEIKNQIRQELYKQALIADKIGVSKEEIKSYFEQNKDSLATPPQVGLSQILVNTEQEANDIFLAVKVGADFGLMAKAKSLDAGSREKGGDLGSFAPGILIPEIEKTAFSLNRGESAIIKTGLGFHVLKVTSLIPAKTAVFDEEMQKNIGQLISREKFKQEFPKYIQALRAKSKIQVFLTK